jgi:hypothetical protein
MYVSQKDKNMTRVKNEVINVMVVCVSRPKIASFRYTLCQTQKTIVVQMPYVSL